MATVAPNPARHTGAVPTPRGLMVLLLGVVLVVLGWLFGLPEASIVGVGAVSAAFVALVAVAAGGRAPQVRRTVRPARVAVGDRCEVTLAAVHTGGRRSPVTSLSDEVDGQGRARVELGPLARGEEASATYSLSTARRGVQRLGPLRVEVGDPFGLARHRSVARGTAAVVVVPRTHRLDPLPAAVGDEPELGSHSMVAASTVDEEFTGLRSYVPGDDVRRIHWPSTARAGSAVVRQFEVPWQRRTTVLLDLRASSHDRDGFERAVTVVASVCALAARHGELLRFATTVEPDAPFVDAAGELDAVLDHLAVIDPTAGDGPVDGAADGLTDGPTDGLAVAVEHLTRAATGRLVVCTGAVGGAEMERVRSAAARAGHAVIVTTTGGRPTPGGRAGDGPARPQGDGAQGGGAQRGGAQGGGAPVHVHWDGNADLRTVWASTAGASLVGGRR